jgi:tetratricopeptide (TPR) repeat protein
MGPNKEQFLAEAVPIAWRPPDEVMRARRAAGVVDWFTDERESLVAAARQAYEDRLWQYVWGIVDVLNGLFVAGRHGAESLELKDLALKAARQAGDAVAETEVLTTYSFYYLTSGQHPRAVAVLNDVRERFTALGMSDRAARMTLALGVVERDRGRLAVAERLLEECLELYGDGDHEMSLAATGHNYAIVLREQGWLRRSADALAHAIPVFHAHGDNGVGRLLHTRAVLNMYVGRLADAEADLDEARPHCAGVDARWTAIIDLGQARLLGRKRQWAQMLDRLSQVERSFRDIEDHLGMAQVSRSQAMALRETGDPLAALALYAQAASAYETTDDDRTKARLTYGTALTLLQSGDRSGASIGFASAERAFVDLDDLPWLLRARYRQAAMRSAADGRAAAQEWADVRRIVAELIHRAGEDHFPAWLLPIRAAAGED